MTDKALYTAKARLPQLLDLSPVDRGGIWWVKEDTWEEVHPPYKLIRNPEREGHYGVAVRTLTPNDLEPIDMLHGHSECHANERWYHLPVEGLTKATPKRVTLFDVLHRFPFYWRLFFTDRVQRYLYRPSLNSEELDQLERIEEAIREQIRRNEQIALKEYRRNPAWRRCFPGQL